MLPSPLLNQQFLVHVFSLFPSKSLPRFPHRVYNFCGVSCAASPLLRPPQSSPSPTVPRPLSIHPVRGEKCKNVYGGNTGRNDKTYWHTIGFPDVGTQRQNLLAYNRVPRCWQPRSQRYKIRRNPPSFCTRTLIAIQVHQSKCPRQTADLDITQLLLLYDISGSSSNGKLESSVTSTVNSTIETTI